MVTAWLRQEKRTRMLWCFVLILLNRRALRILQKTFPERFIEVGVAEQNLATLAAGMGLAGKIPFFSSYATFSPGRNNEQIRTVQKEAAYACFSNNGSKNSAL